MNTEQGRRYKKTMLLVMVIVVVTSFINIGYVEPGVLQQAAPGPVESGLVESGIDRLSGLLQGVKSSDLSFCLGYIKKSEYSNDEIATFISTWDPDAYRRRIPAIFRSKIDRVLTKLRTIDYQQLIIDVDFIKNSQLSVNDMIKAIKGTSLYRKN